jgi:DnaJ-domain-containing protein 1
MEGRFFGVRGARSTTKEFDESVPAAESNRPRQNWQFVSDFQMQMGADSEPDPQFFVESWTIGVTAAMENLQKRQQGKAARSRHGQALREVQSLGTLSFLQERELGAEFHTSVVMGECEDDRESSRPMLSCEKASIAQDPVESEWDSYTEECESSLEMSMPMTLDRAYRLLEVTPASTRAQIKAAYRRKVSHWHPDRLAHRGEEIRQLATRQMAAINEAYRLLRD